MAKPPSEAEIILNRANVALARSQRLMQSWLPSATSEVPADSKPEEEELPTEDKELYKPETLGIGASVPDDQQDGLLKKRSTLSNDRLREQIMGKKAARSHKASKAPAPAPQHAQKRPLTQDDDDDDDEEESRARMVTSSRNKPQTNKRPAAVVQSKNKTASEPHPSDDEEDVRPSKKRPGSYLDQLLAEKATKKKKKQKS